MKVLTTALIAASALALFVSTMVALDKALRNEHKWDKTLGEVLPSIQVSTAICLLGAVGIIVGSLAPWLTTILGSVSGIHIDGVATLILAVNIIILLAIRKRSSIISIALTTISVLGIVGYDLIHIQHVASQHLVFGHRVATAGWGIYACIIAAGIVGIGLCVKARVTQYWVPSIVVVVGALVAAGVALGNTSTNTHHVALQYAHVQHVQTPPMAQTTQSQATTQTTTPTNPPTTTVSQSPPTTTPTNPPQTSYVTPSGEPVPGRWNGMAANYASKIGTPYAWSTGQPCDQNVLAGPDTSCAFAANIFMVVAPGIHYSNIIPGYIIVFSPTTNRMYTLNCTEYYGRDNQNDIQCITDHGSGAAFPVWAANVYYQ